MRRHAWKIGRTSRPETSPKGQESSDEHDHHPGGFAEGQETEHTAESHHEGTFATGESDEEDHPEDEDEGTFAEGQSEEHEH